MAVIEEDKAIAGMYCFKLEKQGHQVLRAGDGPTVLELIKQYNRDILLLDLSMPRMNGDEILETKRAKPWGSETRVIILTNISKNEAPH